MIRAMGKTICRVSIILILVGSMFIAPLQVYAKTETINTMLEELAALKTKKSNQQAQNALTKAEISKYNNLRYQAANEKHQAEQDVEAAKEKIIESEAKISELINETEELMRYMQVIKDENIFASYITDSSSLTEIIMKKAAVEQLTDYYQKVLGEMEDLIIENQELQVELEKKQKDLASKISEYATYIEKLGSQVSEGNDVLDSIDDQIASLQETITFYKSICKSYDQPLSQCTTQLVNATGFNRPLAKGVTTSLFGWRKNPLTNSSYATHYGTDVGGNPEGTSVYAAAAGVVSRVVYRSNCGGNRIYIIHSINGVDYTTEYAHLQNYVVSVGDVVTANTIIGYVGGGASTKSWDTCSTGAHLHFNVSTGHYGTLAGNYTNYATFQARSSASIHSALFPAKGTWFYTR